MHCIRIEDVEKAYCSCKQENPTTEFIHFKDLYLMMKKQEFLRLRIKNFKIYMAEFIQYLDKAKYSFSTGTSIHADNEKYGVIGRDKKLYCYLRIGGD